MTAFGDALAVGLATIRAVAGERIVYTDGTVSIPIDKAVQAKNELQSASSDLVLETVNVVDWSFEAAKLRGTNGKLFEPQAGHRITTARRIPNVTFEVVTVTGKQCFDYLDQDGSTVVVHTQRIS